MFINALDFTIIPSFSSPIAISNLDVVNDDKMKNILKDISKLKFISNSSDYIGEQSTSETSYDRYILNNYPDLKNKITEKLFLYKDNFLMLSTTNFQMTTSWAVRAKKGAYSQLHSHTNSYISGVLYLNGDSNTGDIEFETPIYEQIMPIPTEHNLLSAKTWSIKPQKNLLIFFPSYLRHRIKKHKSNETRYSIAFNFIPYGTYGTGDSKVNIAFSNKYD